LRPSPEDPPYVERGDVIARGAVVALVEIMKTFTPLRLEGVSLPARLRCVETLVEDGQEIAIGDALLRLEEVKQ
jgi:acetyl-CoA carboxylase biotin carboxyl carrier protein